MKQSIDVALLGWLCFALMAQASAGDPPSRSMRHRGSTTEPFSSFAVIDSKLTTLNQQLAMLKARTSSKPSPAGSALPQPDAGMASKEIVRQMISTTASIIRLSTRLKRLYRRRREQYGVKLFAALHRRAGIVQQRLAAMNSPRARSVRAPSRQLDADILNLITQFQAISGGYGAVHCDSGAWACCEPKRRELTGAASNLGCKWSCVSRTTTCGAGFLGPRTRVFGAR